MEQHEQHEQRLPESPAASTAAPPEGPAAVPSSLQREPSSGSVNVAQSLERVDRLEGAGGGAAAGALPGARDERSSRSALVQKNSIGRTPWLKRTLLGMWAAAMYYVELLSCLFSFMFHLVCELDSNAFA